uniref:WAT1-related protein n=1 Tax=Kalanchoe fedtschenkoi TaxID=63787 RepID=A0A7N0VHW1_KALFE
MSIMHSTKQKHAVESLPEVAPPPQPDSIFDVDQIIGCVYLLAAVITLSGNMVLQATTLSEFPAPISLAAVISFVGIFTTLIVQLIQDHSFQLVLPNLSIQDLLTISLLGGVLNGSCTSFNGWALSRKGPVFVSMFNPISTVISAAISIISLGDTISFGSLAGMLLMFSGLYFVLWAKGKEGLAGDADSLSDDPEKPLLS